MRVVRHTEGAFELAELRESATEGGRFLFMKDSVRILDAHRFWNIIETHPGPAWLFARPSCYLAIYDSASLSAALEDAPLSGTKIDSINWESHLHDLLDYPSIWPEVTDWTSKRIDYIDGAPELVIGNDIVEKSKGSAHCGSCFGAPIPGICEEFLNLHR